MDCKNSAAVVIRDVASSDLPTVLWMAQALAISVGDRAPQLSLEQLSQRLLGLRSVARCLVAELQSDVVGYATWSAYFEPHTSTLAMRVSDMYVTPGMRSCGVGTALFFALKQRGANEGYDKIIWDVWTENVSARRFFKSHGALFFADVDQMYVAL